MLNNISKWHHKSFALCSPKNYLCHGGFQRDIAFPTFEHIESVESAAAELEQAITQLFQENIHQRDPRSRTRTAKGIMTGFFRASYPFARTLLSVGASRLLGMPVSR